jgi:hypothetical protein
MVHVLKSVGIGPFDSSSDSQLKVRQKRPLKGRFFLGIAEKVGCPEWWETCMERTDRGGSGSGRKTKEEIKEEGKKR